MNNNDKTGGPNFVTRTLAIPAWLLVLIAVVAVAALLLRITIPSFVWVLSIFLLIIMGWFPRRGDLDQGQRVELSDRDSPWHKFSLSHVPENVTAKLLKIESRDLLRALDKDREIGEITSIAGDLAFSRKDNSEVTVHDFSSPVRLTLNYTDEDEKGREQRQAFIDQNPELVTEADGKKVRLIPIYLYTSKAEGRTDINIWKPFQNYTLDEVSKTVTVEFMFWGDSPTGWGTKP